MSIFDMELSTLGFIRHINDGMESLRLPENKNKGFNIIADISVRATGKIYKLRVLFSEYRNKGRTSPQKRR